MGKLGGNKLNKGFIGVNKFSSSTEGIKNPRNDYLNQVVNATDISNLSPSFTVDFTGPTWQNQVSFSRGGTATFLGSSGYITVAGPNVPRIQYDINGKTLGLLIEPSAGFRWGDFTNFGNWTQVRMVSGATYQDVILAPDGTTTADFLVPNTNNNTHYVERAQGTVITNPDYYATHSVFIKKGNYTAVACTAYPRSSSPTFEYIICVDLNNGNVYNVDTSSGAYGHHVIEEYPNNWWKITITVKSPSFSNTGARIFPLPGNTYTHNSIYAGNGIDGIYAWGSNYHGVGGPMQYILSSGYKVDDSCYISGSSFQSWYTYPGCFYLEYYNKPDKFNNSSLANIWDTTTTVQSSGSTTLMASPYSSQKTFMISNSSLIGNKTASLESIDDYLITTTGQTGYQKINKIAFLISGTTFPYTLRMCLNGSNVQTMLTSTFDPKGITCLMLGCKGYIGPNTAIPLIATNQYNGILKEFRFYNNNFNEDQLRELTKNV